MKLFLTFIFLVILSVTGIAKESPKLATLEIVIDNLDSDEGFVRVHLYDLSHAKNFPDKSDQAFMMKKLQVKNGKAVAVFKDIPFGRYAATLHHDSNRNAKMDLTWLGFPDEGWGLSTDFIPVLSLPNFDKCSFEVNKRHVVYHIKMRYLP